MKYEVYIRQKNKPEPYYIKAMEEYKKRLGGDCRMDYHVVRKDKEWGKLQAESKNPGQVMIRIQAGQAHTSSEQLADMIGEWEMTGAKSVIFLIEDPQLIIQLPEDGAGQAASDSLMEEDRLCLSCFTMPAAVSAMILLEQIYRGYRIRNNQPYHK